jgi:hypothetical protein
LDALEELDVDLPPFLEPVVVVLGELGEVGALLDEADCILLLVVVVVVDVGLLLDGAGLGDALGAADGGALSMVIPSAFSFSILFKANSTLRSKELLL